MWAQVRARSQHREDGLTAARHRQLHGLGDLLDHARGDGAGCAPRAPPLRAEERQLAPLAPRDESAVVRRAAADGAERGGVGARGEELLPDGGVVVSLPAASRTVD